MTFLDNANNPVEISEIAQRLYFLNYMNPTTTKWYAYQRDGVFTLTKCVNGSMERAGWGMMDFTVLTNEENEAAKATAVAMLTPTKLRQPQEKAYSTDTDYEYKIVSKLITWT